MSTTRQKWLRSAMTLATLVVLLAATSAVDYVPARTPAHRPAPAVLATCTHANPWQTTPDMITWRAHANAVAADGHVFVLGGYVVGSQPPVAMVESAPIGADGTLGAWITTTEMTSPTVFSAAVAVNGHVYVVGGGNGQTVDFDSVESAAILPGGQLGAWQAQASLPFPYGRVNLAAAATSTHLYALGGSNYTGTDVSHDVRQSAIHADGSLGPWVAASPMLMGRGGLAAVIAGSFIYAVGGSDLNDPQHSVERAEINADGSLGDWQTMPPLNHPRFDLAALVSDGYLYAIGGSIPDPQFSSETSATIERAAIRADGSLSPWQYVDPLITGRAAFAAAGFNGHFYILGGHQRTPVTAGLYTGEQVTASDLSVIRDNGLTLNDGALFTNQTAVSLTISGQPGITQMQISNDGGFAGAEWQDCVRTIPWTITPYGNSAMARVVYIKFKDAQGDISNPYSDDIILDTVAPTGSVHMTPLSQASNRPAASDALTHTLYLPLVMRVGCPPAGCAPNVMLHLSANDDTSGVGGMQISNDPAFLSAQWEPFAASKAWYLPADLTTVYARFRDNAGNVSSVVSASLTP